VNRQLTGHDWRGSETSSVVCSVRRSMAPAAGFAVQFVRRWDRRRSRIHCVGVFVGVLFKISVKIFVKVLDKVSAHGGKLCGADDFVDQRLFGEVVTAWWRPVADRLLLTGQTHGPRTHRRAIHLGQARRLEIVIGFR
jgi:hypothetical protein